MRTHHLALSLVFLGMVGRAGLAAPLPLTMTCHDPQGTEMSYGPGLLELRDRTVDARTMVLPGTQRTVVIEANQPQCMRVTWGLPPAAPGAEREPATAYDATVIATTDHQMTAVQVRAHGVWMYSLFPKLGIGYVSSHNHVPCGSTSRSLALYALCSMMAPAL